MLYCTQKFRRFSFALAAAAMTVVAQRAQGRVDTADRFN